MDTEHRKERSPTYPKMPLDEALELTRKLHAKAGRANIRPEVALGPLGYSSLNGAALGTIATLKQYGLIERDSSGSLSVSPLSIKLIHPLSSVQESEARKEAALRPKIFLDIFQGGYHDCSEEVLANHLIQIGFTPDGARRAAAVYKRTTEFAGVSPDTNMRSGTQPRGQSPSTRRPDVVEGAVPRGHDDSPTPRAPDCPELPIPLTDGMIARVPFPMTEEDFELLIDTLQLWKNKLVSHHAGKDELPSSNAE